MHKYRVPDLCLPKTHHKIMPKYSVMQMNSNVHNLFRKVVDNGDEMKKAVFMFLERPQTKKAVVYHIMPPLLVFGSICFGIAGTLEPYEKEGKATDQFHHIMLTYELVLLAFFVIEYNLRLWSCSYIKAFQGFRGKLRFICSLYMLIDAFVIFSTLITACLELHSNLALIQMLRFFHIFRLIRIDRRRGDLITMAKVVKIHGEELMTCYFIGSIILYGGAITVYICERFRGQGNETIHHMGDSLYWAVITVTSVGYGDASPNTWEGKVISCVFAIVGCAFFALPAGIIGSGFALQVSKKKKQKRVRKLRNPAACLIQRFWRFYAISTRENATASQATTQYIFSRISEKGSGLRTSRKRKFSEFIDEMQSELYASRKNYAASPSESKRHGTKDPTTSISTVWTYDEDAESPTSPCSCCCLKSVMVKIRDKIRPPNSSSRDAAKAWGDFNFEHIPLRYQMAIQFIHRCSVLIAMRNFKNLRNPYVNMEDLMEKNSKYHMETLGQFMELDSTLQSFHNRFEDLHANMGGVSQVNEKVEAVQADIETMQSSIARCSELDKTVVTLVRQVEVLQQQNSELLSLLKSSKALDRTPESRSSASGSNAVPEPETQDVSPGTLTPGPSFHDR